MAFDLEAYHARFEREIMAPLRALADALDALIDGPYCDECDAVAPDGDRDGIGAWHDEGCALHPENIV